jgi:predicted DNA-binding transcriptional regulator AlpA
MVSTRPEARGPQDLLTSQQVADRLSVSVRTLWRLVSRGSFPKPIRYNRKLVRWKSVDIERYLDSLSSA